MSKIIPLNTDPLMIPLLVSEYEELKRKAAALDYFEQRKSDLIYLRGVGWELEQDILGADTLFALAEAAMHAEGKS